MVFSCISSDTYSIYNDQSSGKQYFRIKFMFGIKSNEVFAVVFFNL
jgi:hypothetical protein